MERQNIYKVVNYWRTCIVEVCAVYCVQNPVLFSSFCCYVIQEIGVGVTGLQAIYYYEYAWRLILVMIGTRQMGTFRPDFYDPRLGEMERGCSEL